MATIYDTYHLPPPLPRSFLSHGSEATRGRIPNFQNAAEARTWAFETFYVSVRLKSSAEAEATASCPHHVVFRPPATIHICTTYCAQSAQQHSRSHNAGLHPDSDPTHGQEDILGVSDSQRARTGMERSDCRWQSVCD